MFDKFKEIAKLKQMQSAMQKETMTVERNGVSVTLNGAFEVQELKLNPALGIDEQEDALKAALNEARIKIQEKMAKSLMASGMGF